MAKLSLKAAPTFACKVGIPVHGGEPAMVEFTFKHRTKDDFQKWLAVEREDVDAILEMAEGWDLAEPLDKENVGVLVQNYSGAAKAIFNKYFDELVQARLGN
jgi:hypothetical protein